MPEYRLKIQIPNLDIFVCVLFSTNYSQLSTRKKHKFIKFCDIDNELRKNLDY